MESQKHFSLLSKRLGRRMLWSMGILQPHFPCKECSRIDLEPCTRVPSRGCQWHERCCIRCSIFLRWIDGLSAHGWTIIHYNIYIYKKTLSKYRKEASLVCSQGERWSHAVVVPVWFVVYAGSLAGGMYAAILWSRTSSGTLISTIPCSNPFLEYFVIRSIDVVGMHCVNALWFSSRRPSECRGSPCHESSNPHFSIRWQDQKT